jgi:branched-chain amino acid transport system substrate-binding protein
MIKMLKTHPILRSLVIFSVAMLLSLPIAGSAHSQSEDPITIGAVLSLSGRDAAFGQECLAGLRIAIEEANIQGGTHDRPLVLEIFDDRSNPIQAAEGVRSLVRDHQPVAIIGSNTSMVTSAAAVAAQEVGVPLIVPEATNPAITSIGDCVYRVCFVDPEMGGGLAAFACGQLKLRRVAILKEEKHDYTASLARQFAKMFSELGGDVVYQGDYPAGEIDFGDALREIKEHNADAIFVSGFFREAGAIVRGARDQGLDLVFLGGDGWESDELFNVAGDAINETSRIYIASHFASDVRRSKVRGFVANFADKEGRRPNTSSALGFDAGGVLFEALMKASVPDPVGVRTALLGVYHDGVTGRIDIDSTRNTTKKVIILRAKPDGEFEFVRAVLGCEKDSPGIAGP